MILDHTSLEIFQSNLCEKCINYRYDPKTDTWGCALTDMLIAWGYEIQGQKESLAYKLLFSPEHGGLFAGDRCKMYYPRQDAKAVLAKERPAKVPPIDAYLTPNKKTVEVPIARLKEIAEYYEFPIAVFFGGALPKNTTRLEQLRAKAEKYERIKEIVEDGR